MKLDKSNPIIALLLLALIGFVVVYLGHLSGSLEGAFKSTPWFPFKAK